MGAFNLQQAMMQLQLGEQPVLGQGPPGNPYAAQPGQAQRQLPAQVVDAASRDLPVELLMLQTDSTLFIKCADQLAVQASAPTLGCASTLPHSMECTAAHAPNLHAPVSRGAACSSCRLCLAALPCALR
jgi:hypothetical protein